MSTPPSVPLRRPSLPLAWFGGVSLLLAGLVQAQAGPVFTMRPAGNAGFDVLADGKVVAPIRLAAEHAIQADNVVVETNQIRLSGFHTKDPLAVTFGTDDFVSITAPSASISNAPTTWEPIVRFKLTIRAFDTNRWLALFPDGPAPFHFLVCSMPTAEVWHQRGWLNPTPYADPFSLLLDVHTGSPEISCLWNRNWSYICPLGGSPIPMIGLWDPEASLYVGYDFQGARTTDQSARYIATAYCWRQGSLTNFVTLAYPYGGVRYGQQAYPTGGEVLSSWFTLEIDTDLPSTEDPNERFQARLFERYTNALPKVPAMNDLGWIPGGARLSDFEGPIGVGLYGDGGETTFYPAGTVLVQGWEGHVEMPIDTALRKGDMATVNYARTRVESLLNNYAKRFTVDGDPCLYWEKPLSGAWFDNWGGPAVTTLHNSEGWYPARVLVELYRYDRSRGSVRPGYLDDIDGLFNWAKHFVWSRNEFSDVPSSPFAIGGTLSTAFLLDYYFTFRDDPVRAANAQLALHLADNLTWRYMHPWAMDSDRFDGAVDSAFLVEPNSGRDWAGLGCANEVNWNIDAMTQVYVHTGDPRMRYYLRGMLQRWPELYQANYEDSIADFGTSGALTEGYGVFDGSGPGRGNRYNYGFSPSLPLNEPVGASTMGVVAGVKACIAFDKNGTDRDVTDYRTGGDGSCSFRVVSSQPAPFDISFSYPFVDISQLVVTRTRNGQTQTLGSSDIVRPTQSPSSLYLRGMRDGDVVTIGAVPANAPVISFDDSLVYNEANVRSVTNGFFITLPLHSGYLLPQNWNALNSFAGIVPGLRWNYGIPFAQTLHGVTNVTSLSAPGASLLLVAYAPPPDEMLTRAPLLVLDNGTTAPLSGHPVLAWQAWPMMFKQKVLLDYVALPSGRSLSQVNPNGTLVMGLTAFTGTPPDWQPFQEAVTAASASFVEQEHQALAILALQKSYAQLPAGRIALLPMDTPGPGANFAAQTGLRKKWDTLTEAQFVNANVFNATQYPVAFYLGSENYVKTVNTVGDGKTAIIRYLTEGGTLVILATGPFPFYYGYGPADQPGPADPLLPALGMPFETFEQAPAGIFMRRYTNQTILHSVPDQFDFPPGDPRLRAVNGAQVSRANRYEPFLKAIDTQGHDYGDPAVFLGFRTGPANGGKIIYVWSTLLAGPQGQAIMADVVTWVLDAVFRPPTAQIGPLLLPTSYYAALHFNAASNLDYIVQARNSLGGGAWSRIADLSAAPTNRSIWYTNFVGGISSRFYRLNLGL